MSFNQNKRTSPIHVGSPSKVAGLRKSSIVEVSDYIVSATLGSGSFGKVKLGVHKATKQEVFLFFGCLFQTKSISVFFRYCFLFFQHCVFF